MIQFLADIVRHGRLKRSASARVAVLCLALLALFTVMQIVHLHPLTDNDSHCPVCIVLHSAAPMSAAAAIIVMVTLVGSAPVFAPRVLVQHRHPKLFTRPPPRSR